MRVCQVCSYEMRRLKWRSVTLCPNHGVRLCTDVRTSREDSEPQILKKDGTPVIDWTWTCQRTDTCWNKFHTFYLPNGLFNNNICLSSAIWYLDKRQPETGRLPIMNARDKSCNQRIKNKGTKAGEKLNEARKYPSVGGGHKT